MKYSKNSPVSILRYHPSDSPVFISATSSPTLADDISEAKDPPPDTDHVRFIPEKYMPWADTVFSPTEVNNLPPHRPYDCTIDLEEGKTPPFGPMYRLTQGEQKALSEYIDDNIRKGFIRRSTSSAASPILFTRRKTDDILIFSQSQDEHDHHVKLVLDRLRNANLFANAKKCEFDKTEVEYLGYLIGADGIKMNPKKLATISEWPVPHTIHEVQSFLGFTNFYCRFVHRYASIALPLNKLTRKGVPFYFAEAERDAFEKLKRAFTSYPVLRHYDPSRPATLSTDASDFALSGVLQQPDDNGHLHPIAYHSRKLSPAEINYEIHDKELLAIIDSFRDMRAWLMGTAQPITVVCDHKNLEYFMSSHVLNRHQARWSMFLSEFDFRLDWAPGSKNVADAPSRRPDFLPKKGDDVLEFQRKALLTPLHTERIFPSDNLVSVSSLSTSTVSALTTLVIDNSELLKCFKTAFQEDTEWREAMLRGDTDFTAQDDMVFHKGRVYVPKSLRPEIIYSRHDCYSVAILVVRSQSTRSCTTIRGPEIIYSRHDCVLGGHPGRTLTVNKIMRDYSWPGIYTYIRRYVAACDTCNRTKIPRHKPYGLLRPLDIPERPWKSISMDFVVKLPKSHGYDSIFVVCDRFTRAAHFIPCLESLSAPDLAWIFIDRIFRYHGLPEAIVSDRGTQFISHFWKALTSQLQIDVRTSTAYHPRSDGLTERTNQTLETYLRAYCSYQQDDWVDYLPLAEFVFNNTENASTHQTPFFANYAYHPTFEPKLSEDTSVPAASDLASRLQQIHEELRAELQYSQERQQKYFNQNVLPAPQYQPDQLVWLLRRNIRTTHPSLKLDHRRLGPYPIIREVGNQSYLLRLPSYLSRLHPVFHTSLLEPYNDPSEFHPHAEPEPFQLADPALSISNFLDCRKTGHRYEYLVKWIDQPDSENSWIPLSDIPSSFNELLERFHRRHPRAPLSD
ncbi:hypothetical protein NLJ89_g10573 [Agrocybe chaxingu]|uniref:Uncharacterized protein n=1 Tax=Agrocybe chaxingu TaxID=84603 RepID=A0A9W8MQ56_9AGAR|nr:hypothetical protein NLJ89_g10573 [Agrocybe chaxingu]